MVKGNGSRGGRPGEEWSRVTEAGRGGVAN